MVIRIALALLLLVSCSPSPDIKISKTLQVSAERLVEIRRNPHAKHYSRGSLPAARITGLDRDHWPPGIVLQGVANDLYMDELGFQSGILIVAINGKKVHDIFVSRWQKLRLRRPAGFHNTHYRDFIEYLLIENKWNQVVLTVYLDLPDDYQDAPKYVPRVEHWRIKLG